MIAIARFRFTTSTQARGSTIIILARPASFGALHFHDLLLYDAYGRHCASAVMRELCSMMITPYSAEARLIDAYLPRRPG